MPLRPSRCRSSAVADQQLAGLHRAQVADDAVVGDGDHAVVLQANAKALSARVKMKPPWHMPCPFSMRSADPHREPRHAGPDRLERHAEPWLARSVAHMRVGAGASQRLRRHDLRPVKRGGRFSRNARTPSSKSGVEPASRCRSRSSVELLLERVRFRRVERTLDQAHRMGRLRRQVSGELLGLRHEHCHPAHRARSGPIPRPACRSTGSPSIAMPRARAEPASRGSSQVPPASGTSPIRMNAC